MDELQDAPDAYFLLSVYRRYHENRAEFGIGPTAMSRAGNPPRQRSRNERARDVLLQRGFIAEVTAPDGRRRMAGRYRLTMPDCNNNHYTLAFLPSCGGGDVTAQGWGHDRVCRRRQGSNAAATRFATGNPKPIPRDPLDAGTGEWICTFAPCEPFATGGDDAR